MLVKKYHQDLYVFGYNYGLTTTFKSLQDIETFEQIFRFKEIFISEVNLIQGIISSEKCPMRCFLSIDLIKDLEDNTNYLKEKIKSLKEMFIWRQTDACSMPMEQIYANINITSLTKTIRLLFSKGENLEKIIKDIAIAKYHDYNFRRYIISLILLFKKKIIDKGVLILLFQQLNILN